MKRYFGLLILSMLFTGLSVFAVFAENDAVGLRLDGTDIVTDTPAMIVSERTLVPARAVFEAMGGTASWDDPLREVTITLGSSIVKLKIDSRTALVNGTAVEMDVAAMIMGERTMIPVRFVSEAIGYTVDWDNDNRIVNITSPMPKTLKITDISLDTTEDAYIVGVTADREIKNYRDFILSGPDRFVLDIKEAVVNEINPPVSRGNDIIKAVRFSQFEAEAVRVVVDLKGETPGRVSASEDQKTLYIEFAKDETETQDPSGVLPELDWRAANILVVIDPGHGGKDPGAVGFENKQEVLYEKDVNLAVALRINELLQEAGVNTYMTRSEDQSIGLLERPAIANAMNADLYVSIHNNSSDNAATSGSEVLFLGKASEKDYRISSRALAESVQLELMAELGVPYRAPQERPLLAVLNKTQMPAIIIEGAFLSNPADLSMIMTDEFKEHYAIAAARAIIKALNDSVIN